MIKVQDWDGLVEETYGRPYSFQQQDGCKDRGIFKLTVPEEWEDNDVDSIPDKVNGREMGVSFKAWLARDPKEWNGDPEDNSEWCIRLFWERNFYPNVQLIANDLHAKGLLPAGEYIINIDW
jgi:hypothetical protein